MHNYGNRNYDNIATRITAILVATTVIALVTLGLFGVLN